LPAGDSQDVRICFHPTQAIVYREVLRFQINGLSIVPVVINGEGTPLKIELADPKQANISFGSIRLGQQSTRMVKLLNRSKLPITLSFEPSSEALAALGVACAPPKGVYLRARDGANFELQYKPASRHPLFTEHLLVEVAGVQKNLLSMTGACLGIEVKLASDNVPFGSVVLGARLVKRVQLENSGDVGTRFAWDSKKLGADFSIDPMEGFLAPGQDCKVEVAFHPTRLSADVRADGIECHVEGFGVLKMTLTGTCVQATSQDAPVHFVSPVRSSQVKSVKVQNNSSENWHIRPAIQNEFWTGAEVLEVLAGREAEYALTYRPMTMTKEGGPLHEGSVFFPRPDGSALLVKLTGQADAPLAAAESSFELKAKTGFKASVMVANWLNKSQRFRATLEVEKGDQSVTFTGPELIDVPGLASREYKLRFYSYKAGSIRAKATFVNEDTGEFLFHALRFEVAPPEVVERFTLECPVRQQAVQLVRIHNPLDFPVELTGKCTAADGRAVPQVVVPASTELKPKAETVIEVLYKPLLAGSATCQLIMQSEQLGLYAYDLHLKSSPALPENPLSFSVPLGGCQTQLFRFRHYLPAKASFSCSLENGAATGFEVTSSTVTAPAAVNADGTEVEVEVAFEPLTVGDQIRDCLLVRSPEAGDYVCTVTGRSLPPAPQGPFSIRDKGSSIPFKNIFAKAVAFTYAVDNPAFVVSKGETVPAQKGASIAVAFKAQPDMPRNGKLVVTCAETATPWVFYLQGA
jgi:hydrocephalus-inducing protein